MSDQTPGPWALMQLEQSARVIARSQGITIRIAESRNLDDMRLISAAPELLEALKALGVAAATLEKDFVNRCGTTVLAAHLRTALMHARQARLKATGETT